MSCRSRLQTGAYAVGQNSILHFEHSELWDGQSRLVIALPGHNGDATQYQQAWGFCGQAAMALARTGRYIVAAINAQGPAGWGGPSVMADIAAAVTWARGLGARTGKYGLLGYSMGGLAVANKLKRDAANIACAWTWAPVTDLAWANTADGTWTTEIATAYGTYADSAGYRVADESSTYAALTVPWRIAHATDDSVVPYTQSTTFVAAVNTSYVSMWSPSITGDHTGLFANVPDHEVVRFFDAATW